LRRKVLASICRRRECTTCPFARAGIGRSGQQTQQGATGQDSHRKSLRFRPDAGTQWRFFREKQLTASPNLAQLRRLQDRRGRYREIASLRPAVRLESRGPGTGGKFAPPAAGARRPTGTTTSSRIGSNGRPTELRGVFRVPGNSINSGRGDLASGSPECNKWNDSPVLLKSDVVQVCNLGCLQDRPASPGRLADPAGRS
jgi:hypothetical protein